MSATVTPSVSSKQQIFASKINRMTDIMAIRIEPSSAWNQLKIM
jgi:hypothetical protein